MSQIKCVGTLWNPDPSFNRRVDSIITEHKNHLKVHRFIVSKKYRGKGIGTLFMICLSHYADKKNKAIYLTPSTAYGGSSVPRLKRFYKRFGFIENRGQNKMDNIKDSMYRLPDKRR